MMLVNEKQLRRQNAYKHTARQPTITEAKSKQAKTRTQASKQARKQAKPFQRIGIKKTRKHASQMIVYLQVWKGECRQARCNKSSNKITKLLGTWN